MAFSPAFAESSGSAFGGSVAYVGDDKLNQLLLQTVKGALYIQLCKLTCIEMFHRQSTARCCTPTCRKALL